MNFNVVHDVIKYGVVVATTSMLDVYVYDIGMWRQKETYTYTGPATFQFDYKCLLITAMYVAKPSNANLHTISIEIG